MTEPEAQVARHVDPAAVIEGVFLAEHVRLVRLAVAITGSQEAAEEVVSDGFLQMWRSRNRVAGLDDPAGWVRRVVINRSISRRRRRATELRLQEILGRARERSEVSEVPDWDLWERVARLPSRQRAVVLLRVVADLTVEECARTLKCKPETVRTHYRRARARLREEMSGDGHR